MHDNGACLITKKALWIHHNSYNTKREGEKETQTPCFLCSLLPFPASSMTAPSLGPATFEISALPPPPPNHYIMFSLC